MRGGDLIQVVGVKRGRGMLFYGDISTIKKRGKIDCSIKKLWPLHFYLYIYRIQAFLSFNAVWFSREIIRTISIF